METDMIPPNLHYKSPRKGVKALEEGRLKVITEPTPWEGGYVGISSFGFGGSNCHVILKSNPKKKINNGAPSDNLPRLVAVSGRTEEAVKVFLDDVSKDCVNIEREEEEKYYSDKETKTKNISNKKMSLVDASMMEL